VKIKLSPGFEKENQSPKAIFVLAPCIWLSFVRNQKGNCRTLGDSLYHGEQGDISEVGNIIKQDPIFL
jgi:hypothetical protein